VHVPEDNTQGKSVPVLQRPSFDVWTRSENRQHSAKSRMCVELTGVAAGRYTVGCGIPAATAKSPPKATSIAARTRRVLGSIERSKIKATGSIEGAASFPTQLQIGL